MSAGSRLGAVEAESAAGPNVVVRARKISVCHIASGDRWAGAEVQIATLLRELVLRDDLALSAVLLNEGRLAAELRNAGIDVLVIPEATTSFFRILREAAKHLRGKGIRILHSHRYKENLLATLLARRCRIPIVVRTQHGAPEPFQGARKYKQAFLQWIDRLTARYYTDSVIAVSGELRERLARSTNSQKIVTIPNSIAIDSTRPRLAVAEAKAKLGIAESSPVIGTAGRLEPVKRLDIFLQAAKRMAERNPEMKFVIAGAGSEEASLRGLAEACGLGKQVLFLGHRDDVGDVLHAMDIFLLTSDHEGLPTVLLEALGLGVPVVTRAVGGIPEVVQDDLNGVLIGTGDPSTVAEACLALLQDEPRRKRLAQEGLRIVAEKFNATGTAEEVARLYASLCGAS